MPRFEVLFEYDDGGISDSIRKQGEEMEKAIKKFQQYEKTSNDAAKSLFSGLIKAEKDLAKTIVDTAIQTQKLEQKTNLANESMNNMVTSSKKGFGSIKDFVFGNLIAGGITGIIQSVVSLGKSIIDAGSNFEKTTKTFENAFGDQTLAKDYIALIQDFAAKTPFEFDKLTDSVLKLTNRGFTPTREELTKLGDLAATTGKDFDQLSEAILDAQTGEFERLKEFGIRAQKDGDTVTLAFRGQVKEIANTEEAIREAIIAYGELDGVQGAMAVQSKTFQGVLSNLQYTLTQISIKIFNVFGPTLSEIFTFIGEKIGYVFEVLQPVGTAFSNLFSTISGGATTTEILSKAWDYLSYGINIVANTLTFLITGIDNTIKSFAQFANESKFVSNAFDFIGNTIGFLFQKIQEIPAFFGAAGSAISQFFKNLSSLNFDTGVVDTFKNEYAQLTKVRVDNEKDNKASLERDEKTEKEILDRRSKNKITGVTKENEEIKKLKKQFQDDINKIESEAKTGARKEKIESADDGTTNGQIKKLDLQKQFDQEDLELRKQATLKLAKTLDERNKVIEVFKSLEIQANDKYNRELAELEKKAVDQYKEERKKYQDAINQDSAETKKLLEDAAKKRLETNLEGIRLSEQAQLDNIESQLKYGKLTITQTEELERQKLEIILRSLQAQRQALGLTVNTETLKLDKQINDAQKELEKFDKDVFNSDLKTKFNKFLEDSLGIDPKEADVLAEGFGALKSAILDVVNTGYEAELNAIDDSISRRQDKISELEGLINEEYEKKENGYANDYDALVAQKANEEALLKEDGKKRIDIQKEQLKTETAIQAAQQVGALVTAVANMVASGSKLGIFGLPLIAASVIGLFALYKNYKTQVKAINSQAAYKGGKISDYLNPGKTARSDRPGYGRGHHVEDTNLVIGADEYLMNAKTTASQLPLLDALNSGKYDNTNIMAMLQTKSDKEHVQDFVIIKEKNERQSKISNDQNIKKVMAELFDKQTKELIQDNSKRPTVINYPDGTVEVINYNTNGVTRKLIKP